MTNISDMLGRRRVLRGMLAGGAVSVGLPILDGMLNENGTAFAATGAPIPVRFGTWFWGLGLGEGDWVPKATGAGYQLPDQMRVLKPFQGKMNFFTGSDAFLDGKTQGTHFEGAQVAITGKVEPKAKFSGSLDTIVGDVIGADRRFRSIEVACSGIAADSWSARADGGKRLAEISPLALYKRIFGDEFKDPNAADFTPDPDVMVRKSALSAIADHRQRLMRKLGAEDRTKLDAYFTSLRSLEQKLAVQLERPAAMLACNKPASPPVEGDLTTLLTAAKEAMERHDLFAGLLAHALACGQTNVANLVITEGMSGLRIEGDAAGHHSMTHEEAIDPVLGYQKRCSEYAELYMKGLHTYASVLDGIKEGDKSLLDRMVVFCFTDHGAPRLHSLRNIPVMLLGGADGRMKTGLHVPLSGGTIAKIGFTVQYIMGVSASSWGTGSNRVTAPIADVIA